MMNQQQFDHKALNLKGEAGLVYTAMSKHLFYYRMHISEFVLRQGKVPLNPFLLFDYFLLDSVDRDVVRRANNSLVLRTDEIWVFGPVSDGVLSEILIAQDAGKEIRYFTEKLVPINREQVEMEEEVQEFKL